MDEPRDDAALAAEIAMAEPVDSMQGGCGVLPEDPPADPPKAITPPPTTTSATPIKTPGHRTPAKTPAHHSPRLPPEDPARQAAYASALRLENDLRTTEVQLSQIQRCVGSAPSHLPPCSENRQLQQLLDEKDMKLAGLGNELCVTCTFATLPHRYLAKDRLGVLEAETDGKSNELEAIHAQTQVLSRAFETDRTALETLRSRIVDQPDSKRDGKPAAEYFHHLSKLENQIRERGRVIADLQGEKRTLEKMLRVQDQAVHELDRQLVARHTAETDLAVEGNKLQALELKIDELEGENRVLKQVERLKTEAIEKLHQEVQFRAATEEYVSQLANEVANRREVVARVEEEKAHLDSMVKRVKHQETTETEGGKPITFEEWHEERRSLLAELSRLQESRLTLKKQNKARDSRMELLQEKIKDASDAVRRSGIPVAEPPSQSDQEEEDDEDLVPIELWAVVERELRVIQAQLEEKDVLYSEKNDVLESLKLRVARLTEQQEADARQARRIEAQLRGEIQRVQEEAARREQDHKDLLRQTKQEGMRTQRRLEKMVVARSEPATVTVGAAPGTPRS